MFEKFYEFYKIDINENYGKKEKLSSIMKNVKGFKELFLNLQGRIFGKGEYRFYYFSEIDNWNKIIISLYPKFKNKLECFASDWLGRQFVIYKENFKTEKILMLDPASGDIFEIANDFVEFHENILLNNYDDCVAYNFFQEWLDSSVEEISRNQCVGYKKPLFLGGKEDIGNLEIVDMEVYWYLNIQLFEKTKIMKKGSKINKIEISK